MIDALKNGDEHVFEEVYTFYSKKIFAYFLKKTNVQEDAKDLLQITFIKLWQYRTSLNEDYLLEQHLFNIARTVFIDYLRKANKLQKIKANAGMQHNANLSAGQFDAFDLQASLQTKLSGMPLLRKRIFELHKIEGYSYREIAEILSITVKSVDNNLMKALKHLRSKELILIILLLNIFH
jgi:RNA polymerase sigma factor (sigma-70 family)